MLLSRFSKRPSKQLVWFFVHQDMKKSRGKITGIDMGCGEMLNYNLFETKKYIGVDLDNERLILGKKKYPQAAAVYSTIEDCENVHGDFVLCIQVFNNIYFQKDRIMFALDKLTSMLNKNGSMIFNIGKDVVKYENEIDAYLKSNFKKIKKKQYGAPFSNNQYNSRLSLVIAVAMYFLPFIRKIGGHDYVYYYCQNKIN